MLANGRMAVCYSASTQEELTDVKGFFKTSFGRLFCFAKNRALRGFRRLRGRSAPLQSLARIPIPQGVDLITRINNLAIEVLYNVQTAVDAKHKLAAAYEATGDGNGKNHLTPTAVADTGYGSVQDIVAGMAAGLDIHVAGTDYDICVPAEEEGDVITGHKDGRCVYYEERNTVLCPAGHALRPAFYKKGKEKEYMPAGKPAGDARAGARRKSVGGGTRYR
jgi:hypothetical protein